MKHAGIANGEGAVLSAWRKFVVGLKGHGSVPIDYVRSVAVSVSRILVTFRAKLIVHQVPISNIFEQIALLEYRGFGKFRSDASMLVELVPLDAGLRAGGAGDSQAFHDGKTLVGRCVGSKMVHMVRRRIARREIIQVHVLGSQVEQRVRGFIEWH